jgi:diguanylate cyclase (GGDEF)-like protein
MYLDLDGFKIINDSLGHEVGDDLLVEVAARVTKLIDKKIIFGRMGGDEFAIIGYHIQENGIAALVEAVQSAFMKPFNVNGMELLITTSIGVSLFPDHGHDCSELLRKADQALYLAKESGKNTHQMYNEILAYKYAKRLELEQGLRRASFQEDFFLLYQPIVDTINNRMIGTEALIRWKQDRAIIAPGEFIPIAEEIGLIKPLGLWIIREACRQTLVWHARGRSDLFVSVNVSVKQLESGTFNEDVRTILDELQFPYERLHLEITESAALLNGAESVKVMNALGLLGIKISIDDFGTGYSSLSILEEFPITTIKIDRSFVQNEQHKMIKAIIAMGNSLKFNIIAEGVETEEQLGLVKEMGCYWIQGYYFCKPIHPSDILSFQVNRQS